MPSNSQLFDKFADIQSLEQEKAKVISIFGQIKSGIKELAQLGVTINSSKSIKETSDAYARQSQVVGEVTKMQQQLDAVNQKLTNSQTQYAKDLASANQQLNENNKLLRLKAQADNAVKGSQEAAIAQIKLLEYQRSILNKTTESGKTKERELTTEIERQKLIVAGNGQAYKDLQLRFEAAAAQAKNLAAQYGVNSEQAKKAAASANQLNNQLKAIDTSVGQHTRNVGNYRDVLTGLKDKLVEVAAGFLALIGVQSVVQFIENAIEKFIELDKASRLLSNTLKNIGSPEILPRITKSIKDLQEQFGFLEKADLTKAFQRLITYGKLTENQINELMPVIINFSAQTGKSIEESTGIFLKSLEGNNRGLKEFGINIRDAKNPTEAFSLIMKELAPRVEGAGKAFGESAAGGIATTKEKIIELKEAIGEFLIPALQTFLSFVKQTLEGLIGMKNGIQDILNLRPIGTTTQMEAASAAIQKNAEENVKAELEIINKRKQTTDESIKQIQQLKNADENYLATKEETLRKGQKLESGIRVANTREQAAILKDQIATAKEEIKLFDQAAQQLKDKNKVLGPGDPNKGRTPPTPPTKEDFSKDVDRVNAEIEKANHEAEVRRIQDNLDADKIIIDNEQKGFNERLEYVKKYYDDSLALSEKNRDFELKQNAAAIEDQKQLIQDKLSSGQNFTTKQREDLNKELETLTRKQKVIEEQITVKYNSEILKANAESEKQTTKIVEDESKRRQKIIEDEKKFKEQHETSVHEINLQTIQTNFEKQDNLLEESFRRREITEKEYNRRKLQNQKDLQIQLIEEDINYTEHILEEQKRRFAADEAELQHDIETAKIKAGLIQDPAAREDALNHISDLEHQAANLRIADNDAIAKSELKLKELRLNLATVINSFLKKKNEETAKDWKDTFDKIGGAALEAFNLIGGLFGASLDRQKNALQDQIDMIDKKKEADIAYANISITNAQERAAVIESIDRTSAARKEQLERRQRQLDQDRAKFEKAQSIASIIVNTAKAVVKALPDVGLAIATAAVGAAELAVAIATPVPHYAKGVGQQPADKQKEQGHPGGDAIVGERKDRVPEMVQHPDGKTYIVDRPTLIKNLPKGSRVVPLTTENKTLIDKERTEKQVQITAMKEIKAYRDGTTLKLISNDSKQLISALDSHYVIDKNFKHDTRTLNEILLRSTDKSFTSSSVLIKDIVKAINIQKESEKKEKETVVESKTDDRVLNELKELNKKSRIMIVNQRDIKTTAWYERHIKS